MLNELIIQAIVDGAMNAYALKTGGRKGWCKEDIKEGVKAYGGSEEDFQNAKILALKTMMESAGVEHSFS